MVVYTIKDLESASGIKAHTIRIWEKRYELFCPDRGSGNRRLYSKNDLEKLIQIAFLIKSGYKISKLASFDPVEIDQLVLEVKGIGHDFDTRKEMMMLSILDLDENRFKRILDTCIAENGLEFALEQFIFPLLNKINILKFSGSFKKVHEYFIIHHTVRKVIQATEELESKNKCCGDCILLYCPKEVYDELTSLYLQFLAKKWQLKTVSLGKRIDLGDLKDASSICNPGYILTFYNPTFTRKSFPEFIDQFKSIVNHQKLLIFVPSDFNLEQKYMDGVEIIRGKIEFETFLKQMQNQNKI